MSQDTDLQHTVLAELEWDSGVAAAHIGVAAAAGVITLTGHVESFAEKLAAETAARRVKGVHAVALEMVVQIPFERMRGDGVIAAAAIERLAWDTSVPADVIEIRVEEGWVTLTGDVDHYHQKRAAEQDVSRLHGVVGVSNQIKVSPRVDIGHISVAIRHALHRAWMTDADAITVTAEDGQVRLTGTVRSPLDRQLAVAVAWAAPGAISVQNDIEIA